MISIAEITIIRNNFPDEWRRTKGNLIGNQYARYIEAQEICKSLIKLGKITRAEFEDPDEALTSHFCIVVLQTLDFSGEKEVGLFADFLKCFDQFTIISEAYDHVELSLKCNIYKEA